MPLSSEELDARYERLSAVASGYLPPSREAVDGFHRRLHDELRRSPTTTERTPAVTALARLIERDGIVRMYVEQMVEEAPHIRHDTGRPDVVRDVRGLLDALNYIVTFAPTFTPPPAHSTAFPMSALFVYMMMTRAGEAAFRLGSFNDALRAILKEWYRFLDSPASRSVLNQGPDGWLSPAAYKAMALDDFVIPDRTKPHWGFKSYNDYFHRAIKPSARPIAQPKNPKAIVSANDGTLTTIARGVKRSDEFWQKAQPFSLVNMLNGDEEMVDRFVGGDVFQSFLSGSNYHRWHAPIDGKVAKAEVVDGLMFSDSEAAGWDPGAGTNSLGYEVSVNTRGLVYIESPDPVIGMVCVIPIGITEISSVEIHVKRGQTVKKGDQLGWFSYGGSTLAMVFQPGAIDHFTVAAPEFPQQPPIAVNAQIAIAN